jgi:ATP-dependent RNA helicase DeaD
MTTPDAPPPGFEAFGLRAEVLAALKVLGYEEPTPIQRETIPALLAGRDVLGQAATGTGKTAAFALPMLEKVAPGERRPFEAQALVLVPTRELAMQVAEAVQKYGAGLGVTALAIYGGQEIFQQIRPLKRGVDVVVATPGRALDHLRRKSLILTNVKVVVLDEADEMLDMGFEEDLQAILDELPKVRQTALFSATLPPRIAKIAEKHLADPLRVTIAARSVEAGTLPNIRQAAYVVQRGLKEAALMRVLEWEQPASAIVFCRTRNEVEDLTHVLMRSGYEPAALHGGLTQEQRDAVLKRFKEGALRVLVATDVAARGLHVENLSHVINFDLPTSPEVYVHRIGRTGRAGKEGVALSFLEPRESRLLQNVERLLKKKVQLTPVPTRAQLDARRAETVAAQVREALERPELTPFLELATRAAEGASMEAVAAAAMWLLQERLFPVHESDQVDFAPAQMRGRPERPTRGERAPRGERGQRSGPRPGFTALSLSLGARAGVRPQDLVGAIANEADVPSKQIHGIRVDTFTSRVEVPTDAVERVIAALEATKLRGRKVKVEREGAGGERKPPRAARPSSAAWAPPPDDVKAPSDDGAEPAVPRPRASTPKASAPRAQREVAPQEAAVERSGEAEAGTSASFGARPDDGRFANAGPRSDAAPSRFGKDRPEGGRFGAASRRDGPRRFGDKPEGRGRFGGAGALSDAPASSFGGATSRADSPRRFGDKPGERGRFGRDRPRGDAPPRPFGDKPAGGGRFGSGGRMTPRKPGPR